MHALLDLLEHLSDDEAPADSRIVGALTATLIVSVVYNWAFWSKGFSLLMEALQWLMSDEKLVLWVVAGLR